MMKMNEWKVFFLLPVLVLSACSPIKESSESVSITASSVEQDETMITKEQFVSLSHKIYDKGYTIASYDKDKIVMAESRYDYIHESEYHHLVEDEAYTIVFHVTGAKYDYHYGSSDGKNWSCLYCDHDARYDREVHDEEWYSYIIGGVAYDELVYNAETKTYDYEGKEWRFYYTFKNQILTSIDVYHYELAASGYIWKYGLWQISDIGTTRVECPMDIEME